MATLNVKCASNSDDIGYIDTSPSESSAYSMGNPGAVLRHIAYRFPGITIPAGSTINSAILRFTAASTRSSQSIILLFQGVDEDNTAAQVASPEDTARTRTKTTASMTWNASVSTTLNSTFDSPDFTSIIQEIVDRGGWSSGNALALYVSDNGSTSGHYIDGTDYASSSTKATELRIDYTPPGSPSPSPSPSLSPSASPSASASPSSSVSLSPSSSNSPSPSPSPASDFWGIRVAKSGKNPLESNHPNDMIFDSDYGTLKYFSKQSIAVTVDAAAGDITGKGEYSHNLGYYPFVEVFVRVYIGSPSGNYEYCPFYGAGATVLYNANYKIDTSKITVYGEINGVSASTWNFDFLVFIYKNNLFPS